MKSKKYASDVIVRELARLQMVCGRKVKRLHTECAEEQNKSIFKDFLEPQGTIKTATAPNSSAANALVERRFEMVFGAARSAL